MPERHTVPADKLKGYIGRPCFELRLAFEGLQLLVNLLQGQEGDFRRVFPVPLGLGGGLTLDGVAEDGTDRAELLIGQ